MIRLDGVTKTYQVGAPPALADVGMGVATGEVIAVMGPSGSGKSVEDNVLLPAQLAGAARARAGQLLERMGIEEHRDACSTPCC